MSQAANEVTLIPLGAVMTPTTTYDVYDSFVCSSIIVFISKRPSFGQSWFGGGPKSFLGTGPLGYSKPHSVQPYQNLLPRLLISSAIANPPLIRLTVQPPAPAW